MTRLATGAALPELRPTAWRAWLAAARPATLGASFAPVMAGSALAAAAGTFRTDVTISALLGAAAIQIGTNLANDYFDAMKGADRADRLGPPRATQRGWLAPRTVARGAALSFLAACIFGVHLVVIGGWPIALLGLAGIAAGVAYTAGPYALAYVGLAEPFVLAFFGVGAVCGTYFLHAGRVDLPALLAGLALGALATAILVVNNLRDRDGDLRANKRTLAVRLGATFAHVEYSVLIAGAYGLALAAGLMLSTGWLWPVVSAPVGVVLVARVWRSDGAALNAILGSTARLELIFAALLSVGVLS